MARNKGTFAFAANYEVKLQELLDPRGGVTNKEDLINKETFPYDENTIYMKEGMLVSVSSTREVYMLVSLANILAADYSGWVRIAGENSNSGSGAPSITVDAKLSETSTNPVQNKTITEELKLIKEEIDAKVDYEVVEEIVTPEGNLDLSGYATTKWVQETVAPVLDKIAEIENALLQDINNIE